MKDIETLSLSVFIVIEAVVVVTPSTAAAMQHPSYCVFVSRGEKEKPPLVYHPADS
jgi:hypothetical protein